MNVLTLASRLLCIFHSIADKEACAYLDAFFVRRASDGTIRLAFGQDDVAAKTTRSICGGRR